MVRAKRIAGALGDSKRPWQPAQAAKRWYAATPFGLKGCREPPYDALHSRAQHKGRTHVDTTTHTKPLAEMVSASDPRQPARRATERNRAAPKGTVSGHQRSILRCFTFTSPTLTVQPSNTTTHTAPAAENPQATNKKNMRNNSHQARCMMSQTADAADKAGRVGGEI